MQNCAICSLKLGDTPNVTYETNEKVWLVTLPCCSKSLCFSCLLKQDSIKCKFCDEDVLHTLRPCVARLCAYKPS